ncbi:phospholipase A1-like [Rhodnius prolixus]|uniref:phospholipase A1-like n=1 Tax=Rhodnius prolixus TaxID=13249 RepID=UPI003D1888E4
MSEIASYNQSEAPYFIDPKNLDNLERAPFMKELPIKLIISGFNSKSEDSLFGILVPAYKNNENYNVMYVSYVNRTKDKCDRSITAKNLSTCIYTELKKIFEVHQIKLKDVHVISASLGVVLAGYMVPLFGKEKLARFTGLDPAVMATFSPCMGFSNTDEYPVSSESAHFVDIHHTNMLFSGYVGLLGHLDVIYNNGRRQEACDDIDLVANFIGSACSHRTMNFYYAQSVFSKVGFWGKPCRYIFNPYDENDTRICATDDNEEEILVGESVSHQSRGLYHVITNPTFPYSKGKMFS